MMKKKLGNLKIESLYNIFSNEKIYSEYWEKTKNVVDLINYQNTDLLACL